MRTANKTERPFFKASLLTFVKTIAWNIIPRYLLFGDKPRIFRRYEDKENQLMLHSRFEEC